MPMTTAVFNDFNGAGNARQRRPTRRRRSSSATLCSPSASTTSIVHHSHSHDLNAIRKRAASPQGASRLDWRRSKRSASDLAGLRFLVLSHIEELEKKLEKLDPISCPDASPAPSNDNPITAKLHPSTRPSSPESASLADSAAPSSRARSIARSHSRSSSYSSTGSWANELGLPTWDSEFDFSTVEDLRTWVQDSLDQLAHLRSEVSARLPDLEEIRAHFADFDWDFEFDLDVKLDEFRAKLARVEVPNLQEMKTKIGDLGYEYLPTLSEHLSNLHSHMRSLSSRTKDFEFHSKTLDRGHTVLRDFIDALMYTDEDSPMERKRVVDAVERTVLEVRRALVISEGGSRLIGYHQLPVKWRNNEHVRAGYRFIPLSSWPSLLRSAFQVHNETAHIHTHLLPFITLGSFFFHEAYSSYVSSTHLDALPTTLFSLFSMLCLVTSIGWHIFAGCSDPGIMEIAARVDYLGIGWLISASIATMVYYAFSCRRWPFAIYIGMTIIAGLAGSVLPFMEWFNERKHKKWRIVFFLSLSLTGFIPVVHLCAIHGAKEAFGFTWPIVPSLASYVFGLVFYAFHFPECLWQGSDDHTHEHHVLDDERTPLLDANVCDANLFNNASTSQSHDSHRHAHVEGRWTDWIGGGSHAIWHVSIVAAIWLHRSAIPQLALGLGGEMCDVWNRG